MVCVCVCVNMCVQTLLKKTKKLHHGSWRTFKVKSIQKGIKRSYPSTSCKNDSLHCQQKKQTHTHKEKPVGNKATVCFERKPQVRLTSGCFYFEGANMKRLNCA